MNALRASALPRSFNRLRNGLTSQPFRDVVRALPGRARRVLALAVQRALADALAGCPDGRGGYASARRNFCRHWALRRVLACLDEADLATPLMGDLALELCLAFAPIWVGVNASPFSIIGRGRQPSWPAQGPAFPLPEDERSLALAEALRRTSEAARDADGTEGLTPYRIRSGSRRVTATGIGLSSERWRRPTDHDGRAQQWPGIGAYQQFNRMGHGLRSRLFGPLARSLPPRVRPLLSMAIEWAVQDALAEAPPASDDTRYASAARGYARMRAARRVLQCAGAMDLEVPGLPDDAGVRLCYALAPIWVGAGSAEPGHDLLREEAHGAARDFDGHLGAVEGDVEHRDVREVEVALEFARDGVGRA